MANPFKIKFNSECQECGNHRYAGDEMYRSESGLFVCEVCAEEAGNVCPLCKKFKKEQYDACYECGQNKKVEDSDAIDPDDIPF